MPSPEPDPAFIESMRTEQHPDRERPDIAQGVAFHRAVVIGCNQGRDLQADLFTPTELPSDLRPAIVFLHGTEDRCVSHGQSLAFHQRLHEHSVDSEIEIYEGTPHAWFNREPDRTTTYERIEAFIHSRFALEPAPRPTA